MAIFILVFTLLIAFLAIALLLGIAPISSKAKYRTMYVGANPYDSDSFYDLRLYRHTN